MRATPTGSPRSGTVRREDEPARPCVFSSLTELQEQLASSRWEAGLDRTVCQARAHEREAGDGGVYARESEGATSKEFRLVFTMKPHGGSVVGITP